jgi:hypothetical protein
MLVGIDPLSDHISLMVSACRLDRLPIVDGRVPVRLEADICK